MAASKCILHVYNINYQTTPESLEAKFREFGNFVESKLYVDKDGFSKGCCDVTYSDDSSAAAARKALSRGEFEGRQLYFTLELPSAPPPPRAPEAEAAPKPAAEPAAPPERRSAQIPKSSSQNSFPPSYRGRGGDYERDAKYRSRAGDYGAQRPYDPPYPRYHQRKY